MEIGTIALIITTSGVMAGVAKIIYELSGGGKLRLREEYRFAKEFLSDIQANEKLHHLAIERGYYALAGTTSINVSDIKYLISLSDPSQRLRQFVSSKKFLEFKNTTHKIGFRQKYKSEKSRVMRKTLYVGGYIVGGFLAISPITLAEMSLINAAFKSFAFVTIPCIGFYAAVSLQSAFNLMAGEALVSNQQQDTPPIFTNQKIIK